jgi:hypothetical protein
VALAALKGDKTLVELATPFDPFTAVDRVAGSTGL